ncbi:MAG: ABC transporter permease, partial [Anaerolineales bacterium]
MTRWTKVARDLWNNRSRTILVVLSIVIGVFSVGMIVSARQALTDSLTSQYAGIRPADAILQTEPALTDDFVQGVRKMRGVSEAEGRRSLPLRISLDGQGETWRDLTLYALADYSDQNLFLVHQQDGTWPPEKGEVLLERASMEYLGLAPGDQILVKTPRGQQFHLTVSGRAHDLYRIPPVIEGWIYGYVSTSTLRWMGEANGYNELYISASPEAQIAEVTDRVANRI